MLAMAGAGLAANVFQLHRADAECRAAARDGGWIAPGALVVWEESAPQPAPEGFALLEERRYGDTHVTFLEAEPAAGAPEQPLP